MGSFSWLRATKTTKRKNIVEGDKYKILIPEEFGGGCIIDTYFGYGYVFEYDDTKPNADLYGIDESVEKIEVLISYSVNGNSVMFLVLICLLFDERRTQENIS